MVNLSKDEERLLAAFALLSDEQQEIVLEAVQVYAKNDRIPASSTSEQQQ